LIIAGPGVAAAKRDDPVSLIDITPTLAALAHLPNTRESSANLLAAPARDREIYAETQYPRVAGWSPVRSLVQDRWKMIVSRGPELYDLANDATESQNVAATRDALVRAMGARLEALSASKAAAPLRATPSDVAERLRALGYVAGSSAPLKPGEGPNPADHIVAWNEFETALAELAQPRSGLAVARLRKLAAEHPDAPVFVSTYARALAESGAAREALTIYRRAVAKWPGDATLFHELAVAARDAGAREEAMKAEQAALAIQPAFPAAHNGVGLLLTDANRHAEAANAFEAATGADPTNAEYWVNLGNARRGAGNDAAAESAYRRAAEIDPASSDAANGLGVLLVQHRRAAEAIPLFERAIAASPDSVEARLNLGIAYQESGQRDRAIGAYREVLARAKPDSPERRAATDLLRSLAR
jgi:tetratricopeptide (TPR) repeat protein